MKEPVIEIQELTKTYGESRAVDHLSLTIQRGEIFGLLGPNGAGKSTTILMLLGLSEPDSGSVKVLGINSTRQPIQVKRRVGYLPDDVGFYEDRTGWDNLMLTARLNRVPEIEAEERAEKLLKEVGLSDAAHKKAGAYSRGMRQRLGLADVLMKGPEIIILDEPTLGIDPKGMNELLDLIQRLSREQGLTVLLSSHHLHQVQQICDRVGLFVSGRLLAEGDVASLSRKLFADDLIPVTVELDACSPELLEHIRALEGVVQVETKAADTGDRQSIILQAACREDRSAEIARAVVQAGTQLYRLEKKQYGLDEIYQRYFAGGDEHDQLQHAEHTG